MDNIIVAIIVAMAVFTVLRLLVRQIRNAGQGGGCASCGSKSTCTSYKINKASKADECGCAGNLNSGNEQLLEEVDDKQNQRSEDNTGDIGGQP